MMTSPIFDLDKLETGKPTKFISNGLYLPKVGINGEKCHDPDNSLDEIEATLTNIPDLPTRAKTPINSNMTYLVFAIYVQRLSNLVVVF